MEGIDFYREVSRRLAAGERLAMATVVRTKGSTPREVGAKMAVTGCGGVIGTVGGGYAEHEAVQAALATLETGKPTLLHIELTADVAAREGAVCGGTLDVFVEVLAA